MEEKAKKSFIDQVHICFSSSGRGSLKYAISKGWVEGKTLCDSDIESLTKEWDILKKENSGLRAYDGVKIISVPVEYYDKYILSCAEADYGKCARTVGEALGKHEYLISDTLVFWRILEMIKLEQIEYKGRLGIMREMEIRKGGF